MISKKAKGLSLCASILLASAMAHGAGAASVFLPDRYDVVWDCPSADQNGSMPPGNGSTGLNA